DRQTHLGAGRPIKHPRWNLQPKVRVGCSQVAAKDNTARPLNCLMNADPQAGPWMPRIQQLPKLGTVGVLKPCCTTRSGPTHRSDTSRPPRRYLSLPSPRGRLRYANRLPPATLAQPPSSLEARVRTSTMRRMIGFRGNLQYLR